MIKKTLLAYSRNTPIRIEYAETKLHFQQCLISLNVQCIKKIKLRSIKEEQF
jgi:hypothetical protein